VITGQKPARAAPLARHNYKKFVALSTRWSDNDVYGHINNAAYYLLFDAAVNALLVEAGLLDPARSPIIGLVAESHCGFFAPLAFPDAVDIGVGVEALGRSSVRYRLGAFKRDADSPAAQGGYTHVYVERTSGKSVPIPAAHRRFLETLQGG